jgi:flagellar basal body-associated protein FliL
MGTLDIIMLIFLAVVFIVGLGSLYYFMTKEE